MSEILQQYFMGRSKKKKARRERLDIACWAGVMYVYMG